MNDVILWVALATPESGSLRNRFISIGSLLDPARGWPVYLKEYIDPIIQVTGAKRIMFDCIWGRQPNKVVHYGAWRACQKLFPHLTAHDEFVDTFDDFRERNGLDELIGYIGTPSLDTEYPTDTRPDQKRQYRADATNTLLESEFSIGLDAATSSKSGPTDWIEANSLVNDGATVYVEGRCRKGQPLNVENLGVFEATPNYMNQCNYTPDVYYGGDVPKFTQGRSYASSWQDSTLAMLGRAKTSIVHLHTDTVNFWNMTLDEAAHRIKCWRNYEPIDSVSVPIWLARRLAEAGKWE